MDGVNEDGIDDEEEEEEERVDPLMGTMEDILEEDEFEEEEMKAFDIEKDTATEKVVVFYIEFSEFVQWECGNVRDEDGVIVSKIQKNDCGKALFVETGIESGWNIVSMDDKNVSDKNEKQIEKILKKCDIENGFKVIFRKIEKKKDINTTKGLRPSVYKKSKKKTTAD